jgi:phosphatidylinositol alpha-mannosyltransferase
LHRFDAHCAVSSAARDFAKWAYGIEAEVIPNAVETDRFAVDSPQDQKAVVFLGRLVERKGAMEFLHAIAALPADMRAKHPVIVAGRGPLEQNLKQYAAAHNLEVNFLGFVDEADKPALLASAELAVFPSISGESFGIVLIEAMAAGSGMVIAGNNPGYASVLANTPEALVNPRDITSFPALIARSLEDESFRKDIHERQEKLVKEFNIASVGPNLINLYSSAIAKQR